jgi:hypothetical protein
VLLAAAEGLDAAGDELDVELADDELDVPQAAPAARATPNTRPRIHRAGDFTASEV